MVQTRGHVTVIEAPFDPEKALAEFRLSAGGAGAIVSFTGVVRPSASEREVSALHLQHYPGYTEKAISQFAEVVATEKTLIRYNIIHRVGEMHPNDPIVFVATASIHRRAAFEAADQMMDFLKTSAPFWKKEVRSDGDVWIEPREQDYQDQARWTRENEE